MTIDERLTEMVLLQHDLEAVLVGACMSRNRGNMDLASEKVALVGHWAERLAIQCRLAAPDLAESARQGVAVSSS